MMNKIIKAIKLLLKYDVQPLIDINKLRGQKIDRHITTTVGVTIPITIEVVSIQRMFDRDIVTVDLTMYNQTVSKTYTFKEFERILFNDTF